MLEAERNNNAAAVASSIAELGRAQPKPPIADKIEGQPMQEISDFMEANMGLKKSAKSTSKKKIVEMKKRSVAE